MIAVTFALPAESNAFVRRLNNVQRAAEVVRGSLGDLELRVLHTGVGAHECEQRLLQFLTQEPLRLLISSGFCGGTNDDVAPGTLVVAENYSDAKLANKAEQASPGAIVGKLYSANRIVDPAADRYAIGREHGAVAIDMETETIARLCAASSIPMLSLRVVSDSPAAPFPAPPEVLFDVESQRTRFSRLLAHLAREPAAVIRLVKFSRQIASARLKLAEALCAIIAAL
jgi:nucleoside phosphorylase